MPMVQDVSCLESSVKNISGGSLHFSFLGSHGITLAANEVFTVLGPMEVAISNSADDGSSRRRKLNGYLNSLKSGDLEVVKTPVPHLVDLGTDATKTIKVTNGTLASDDPCLLDSVSE